ncbi:MAG: hypothetical protein PHE67_00495 [Campylobacterales bacterium]|nr:hypothetical protein [Campylobacterales bacterium]
MNRENLIVFCTCNKTMSQTLKELMCTTPIPTIYIVRKNNEYIFDNKIFYKTIEIDGINNVNDGIGCDATNILLIDSKKKHCMKNLEMILGVAQNALNNGYRVVFDTVSIHEDVLLAYVSLLCKEYNGIVVGCTNIDISLSTLIYGSFKRILIPKHILNQEYITTICSPLTIKDDGRFYSISKNSIFYSA